MRENLKFDKINDLNLNKIAINSFKNSHKSLLENLEKNFSKILTK